MTKRLFLATAVLCVFVGCAGLDHGPGAQPTLLVGAASAPVNPPDGTYLAGYDQDRKSTGVHDNLYAKAVVFSDETTAVALVVVDCIGLQYDTVNEIRAAASEKVTTVSLPPERIVVQSTHTHCGPDVIGIWGPDEVHTGRHKAYLARLVETAAEQVARAAANLRPAHVAYAQTECTGWAVNDSEPDIVDHSVTVLQCTAPSGESVVTLTNFACHPTVLDGDTTQVSADWVGYFYESMAALPGEHLFLQGAVGAWIQPVTPERTFALAEQYGTDLADKVLAALDRTEPLEDTALRFAHRPFAMPIDNDLFRMMGALGLVPRDFTEAVQTEVAWFAVGPAQFATHPGETAPAFAAETRALMDTQPKFILGLGLDELGYICPTYYFERTGEIPHADYLISMSPSPQAGPAMMAVLAEIIP